MKLFWTIPAIFNTTVHVRRNEQLIYVLRIGICNVFIFVSFVFKLSNLILIYLLLEYWTKIFASRKWSHVNYYLIMSLFRYVL